MDIAATFGQLPLAAHVETDCFCPQCGYNLHTQAVRRDPRTQILLTRCPECGRFHPAGHAASASEPWLRRLALLGLVFWISLIISAAISAAFAQGAITFATLDTLTTFVRVADAVRQSPGYHGAYYLPRPKGEFADWPTLYTLCGLTSLGLGLIMGAGSVIVCHHWRRWAHITMALAWPAATGLFMLWLWHIASYHWLTWWGLPYIAAHALVYMVGSLLGVAFGRPLGRLAVRICLPPRLRPIMAFLWRADGLEPPVRD